MYLNWDLFIPHLELRPIIPITPFLIGNRGNAANENLGGRLQKIKGREARGSDTPSFLSFPRSQTDEQLVLRYALPHDSGLLVPCMNPAGIVHVPFGKCLGRHHCRSTASVFEMVFADGGTVHISVGGREKSSVLNDALSCEQRVYSVWFKSIGFLRNPIASPDIWSIHSSLLHHL